MKEHKVRQGSQAWLEARVGLPTASNFHRIVTVKKLARSTASEGYMNELLAESFLGHPLDAATTDFMQRGSELEDSAAAYYELMRDTTVRVAGFCTLDNGSAGCSPDRFVGDDGLVEIKCPSAAVHVGNMRAMTIDYLLQIQGQLWICERRWCDLVSFHPDLPPVVARVPRNDAVIEKLSEAVAEFCRKLEEARADLIDRYQIEEAA